MLTVVMNLGVIDSADQLRSGSFLEGTRDVVIVGDTLALLEYAVGSVVVIPGARFVSEPDLFGGAFKLLSDFDTDVFR